MNLPIKFSDEILNAKDRKLPIVALESTIITHGMPYPQNLSTAIEVEEIVRRHKAVPATIAILNGKISIGMSRPQLTQLAKATDARKLSRADLPLCLSRKNTGSTTVAATMICARLANINVFATGGIGGVHKNASETMDISADLNELSKTNVSVIAAGPKAILDIPKTLEVLETLGVPVISYQNDQIPAFWSRESGCQASIQIEQLDEIAAFIKYRDLVGLNGGCLITNPVPKKDEIPKERIVPIIENAIRYAEKSKISGKALTPFLLTKIFELTDGKSLKTNISLIKNNAKVAAKLSVLLKE
jgi:pseudouridine-5'-phosphate glycosidase